MAKDINIHLKTHGAERTKQQLEDVGRSSKQVGDKTAEGHREGAEAVEKTSQKMTGMGRVVNNLKSAVLGFIGGFLGLQGVIRLVDYLQQKLQRIQQIQQQIYDKSLSLAEIGQALEFQTGTLGRQQYWVQQALRLQAAGALASPEIARQMMISMDIVFARQGGIKSRQIQELAMQLAPFVGTAGLGPEEVAKLFEFAGTAGVAPTERAYKDYFAKVQAGYTASKATSFGAFMEGLQKGGTTYMAMGGTLEEAISAFAAARSVMANEALAATLVEQVARLSSGAYAKPRQAIEQKLGVRWQELSMDERMRALLQYVEAIPEAARGEVLAEQGFPIELSTQIGKMVSPEARRTMEATRDIVEKATADMIEKQTRVYMESMLAEQRKTEAEISGKKVKKAPEIAGWRIRMEKARADFELMLERGEDRWVKDSIEPYLMALETLEEDITKALPSAPKKTKLELLKLRVAVRKRIAELSDVWISWREWPSLVEKEALELTRQFESISRGKPFEQTKTMQEILGYKQPKIKAKEIESTQEKQLEDESKKYSWNLRKQRDFALEMIQKEKYYADEWRSKLIETKEGTERYNRIRGHIEGHEEQVRYYQDQVKWYEKELKETAPFAYPEKKTVEVGSEQQQVKAPVEIEADKQQIGIPVEAVAEKQIVGVPVETEVERQKVNVPFQPVAMSPAVEHEPQTIVHQHYYYDYGIRFYPRVGDPEIGPRIEPGAFG